jgi:hypothetical protein
MKICPEPHWNIPAVSPGFLRAFRSVGALSIDPIPTSWNLHPRDLTSKVRKTKVSRRKNWVSTNKTDPPERVTEVCEGRLLRIMAHACLTERSNDRTETTVGHKKRILEVDKNGKPTPFVERGSWRLVTNLWGIIWNKLKTQVGIYFFRKLSRQSSK